MTARNLLAAAFVLMGAWSQAATNTCREIRAFPKPGWIRADMQRFLKFWAPLNSSPDAFGGGSTAPAFTRATPATHYSATTGLVVKDLAGAVRFEKGGYLSEVTSTNIALRSEELDNAYWAGGATGFTIAANATVAPDGTTTAETFTESSGSAARYISKALTGTAGGTNVLSIFAKSSNRYIALGISGSSNDLIHFFKLSDGTVGTASEVGGAYSSEGSIEPVPGYPGYYRCSVVITTTADTPILAFIMMSSADATRTYAGDGASNVEVWGMSYASGDAFLTSYIPTTAATVTRDPDKLGYPVAGNTPAAAGEGTIFANGLLKRPSSSGAKELFCTRSSTSTNGTDLRIPNVPAKFSLAVNTASAQAAIEGTTTITAGASYRVAGAFAHNDVELFVNGASEGTDTSATMPTHTEINVGQNGNDEKQLGGNTNNAMIFSTRFKSHQVGLLR